MIAGGVVVAVVGVGYAAYAASADTNDYRTATAKAGDVKQTLDVSGSVEPAGRADLSFATSGTIQSVTVKAGDTVKAGTVLGTLDDTSLRKTLQQARSTLAAAKAQLEKDEDAQADTVSSASSSGTTSSGSQPSGDSGSQPSTDPSTPSSPTSPSTPSTPDDGDDGGLSEALAQLAAEQEAVTSAQSTVSASMASAQEALTTQQSACADAFSSDDSSAEPTDGASDGTGEGTGDAGSGDDAANQACTDALTAVQAAQQQVSDDQDTLQAALEDLSGTLTDAVAALQSSGGSTSGSTGGDTGGSTGGQTGGNTGGQTGSTGNTGNTGGSMPSTGSGSAASGSTDSTSSMGSTTVTAATLASDQAAIDEARADLIEARQALRTATIAAPFAGRIVAVDAAEGDSVSSGTEVFVLVAPGTTTVQVEASSTQVQQLAVGQEATATPAGSDKELTGTVTQISTVPDDSSTYPVTITLDKKNLDIATGLNASVSIVIGAAEDVVTVPASAVSDGVVNVIGDDGSAVRTRVTTGVVGATRVEITDGLEAGDEVVLADLDQALPSSDDSDQQSGFGGGGFGGGGFGGGNFSPPSGGGFPGR